jgi:hypothetical protein
MSYDIENQTVLEKFKKTTGYSAYQPFTGDIKGEWVTGWIRAENGEEKLQICYKGKTISLYSAMYIQNPVVISDRIVFSAYTGQGEDWPLYEVKWDSSGETCIQTINHAKGRVMSIRAELQSNASWLVYECRKGKKVQVYAAKIKKGKWIADLPVTDESINAYDPHVASISNGEAYVVYNVFIHGNYNIYMQKLEQNGQRAGHAQRVSGQPGGSFWPSICNGNEDDIWISWGSLSYTRQFEDSYLQHHTYKARRKLFTDLSEIYVVQYDQGKFYVPQAANGERVNFNKIPGTLAGNYPSIVQTPNGLLHLIYSKYSEEKMNKKANLCISTLSNKGWSNPVTLVEPILHEHVTSLAIEGYQIRLAFARDERVGQEWFDLKNSIYIGSMEVSISNQEWTPEKARDAYLLPPVPIPSIEEQEYPKLERKDQLIWGQTHCHTNLSVCQRRNDQSLDFNYRFFQDVMKSDFGCITDHCYNQWPLEEHINHKMADYYYFPGEFVAFPAYEWTGTQCKHEGGPFGHVNCLFLEESGVMKFYTPVDPHCKGSSLIKLWETYKNRKVITIPHHTSDMTHTFNWEFYNSDKVPLVEVFQDCRGQHEQPGAWGSTPYRKSDKEDTWVIAALQRYKIGIIGVGDHSGVARGAVEVQELTRTGLYEGMIKKRTYASTEMGVDIRFTANHQSVGSVLDTEKVSFKLEMTAAENIAEAVMLKNGEVKEHLYIHKPIFIHEWDVEYDESQFWYCRILLENGEVVWSSPIWLNK